jgi:flagellar export protein FliJ
MNVNQQYPLAQVMEVKERRVDEAQKVLKEKIALLEKENEKLKERERDRDKAKTHMRDKLTQLRAEMDHGTSIPKIQQMKAYLKICQEKVVIEEKKVVDQMKQVETAKNAVEAARQELAKKQLEVDKIKTHKQEWLKEKRKEEEIEEGKQMDEVGTVIFLTRKRLNASSNS